MGNPPDGLSPQADTPTPLKAPRAAYPTMPVKPKGVVKLRNDPMEPFKQLAVMGIGMLAVGGAIVAAVLVSNGSFGAPPEAPPPAQSQDEPPGNETVAPELPEPLPEMQDPSLPQLPADTGI